MNIRLKSYLSSVMLYFLLFDGICVLGTTIASITMNSCPESFQFTILFTGLANSFFFQLYKLVVNNEPIQDIFLY